MNESADAKTRAMRNLSFSFACMFFNAWFYYPVFAIYFLEHA